MLNIHYVFKSSFLSARKVLYHLEVGCGRKLKLDGGDDGDDDQHEGEAHHDAVLGGKTFHFSDDVKYLIISKYATLHYTIYLRIVGIVHSTLCTLP